MMSQELKPPDISCLTESARYRPHTKDEDVYPQFCPPNTRLHVPPPSHPLRSSPDYNPDSVSPQRNHYYVNITHGSISPTFTFEAPRESSVTDWEDNSSSSVDSITNGMSELNRYNQLKLAREAVGGARGRDKGGIAGAVGGRNRRIQCRSVRTDSESSSASFVSENGDVLDAKLREIEHYNRLKLNLDRVPQSKKALKGLRVLNKIPSIISHHQGTPPPMAQPPKNVDKRRNSEDAKQTFRRQDSSRSSRYKNESHVNKLHSVSGQPVRTPSSTWDSRPRSRSTSDVVRAVGVDQVDGVSDRRHRSRHTGRSRSFNDIHNKGHSSRSVRPPRITRHDYPDPDGPLVSTPFESPSRHRRRNEDAREGATPPQPRRRARRSHSEGNIRGIQLRQRVKTSESFTSGMHVSIETGSPSPSPVPTMPSQSVHSTQVEPLSPPSPLSHAHGVPFLDPVASIRCDSEGGEYRSEVYDFRLSIPKGAIKKRTTVEIHIGFALHGPFKFPGDLRPVSPIVWLCSTPEVKLRKPVEIMLPHYLDTSVTALSKAPNSASCYSVQFLKASHTSTAGRNETSPNKTGGSSLQVRQYLFLPTEGEEWFWSNENHGTLQTKHLCFICIGASKAVARLSYGLVTVIPRPISDSSWKIKYCVTYWLKRCIAMVKEQHSGEDVELLPPRMFRFDEKGPQAKLEVQFQREIPSTGWILALESDSKIRAGEVDFWSVQEAERDLVHCTGTYPPMFTIRVHGEDATAASVAMVSFKGASEDLRSEVILPIRNRSGSSSHREAHVMVHPSSSSTHHCHGCSCSAHGERERRTDQRFGNYDHLLAVSSLDQTHAQLTYHNGRVDIPSDQDLATVAQHVTEQLSEDWALLQTQLEIPDHVMLDVLQQRTINQQVLHMLKDWRRLSKECSKAKLSECLWKADARLRGAAKDLLRT